MQNRGEHIHDENFKHNFSRPDVIRDFIATSLPTEVLDEIAIDTLRLEDRAFLPTRYRSSRRADLIYSVGAKEKERIYLVLHLEAQSTVDATMALRVWECHTGIAKAHIKEGNVQLPLILSFVFYNGDRPWQGARSIAGLFENFDRYVALALKAPFLVELKTMDQDAIIGKGASAPALMLMRGNANRDQCSQLGITYPLLKKYRQLDDINVFYMVATDRRKPEVFSSY